MPEISQRFTPCLPQVVYAAHLRPGIICGSLRSAFVPQDDGLGRERVPRKGREIQPRYLLIYSDG